MPLKPTTGLVDTASKQALDNLRIQNPRRGRISYDQKCLDLAEYFIQDVDGAGSEHCKDLAAEIQQTIEDFISDHQRAVEAYMSRVNT